MSLRVRPGRPLAPMAVTVVVVGTWWLVAHNSGAGWVQVLGDVVFGALLVGHRRSGGRAGPGPGQASSSAPLDTTAGLPVEVADRSFDAPAGGPRGARRDRDVRRAGTGAPPR